MPLARDVLAGPCRLLPAVVELAQGVVVLLLLDDGTPRVMLFDVDEPSGVMVGNARPSKGLIPPLSISVAPRGTVPPARADPAFVPGVDNGEAVPLKDNVADVQLELEEAPPPSKVELVPAMLEPLVPDILREEEPADAQFALDAGLKPPGSISVAPSGMPVPLAPLDPGMPNGDVAPIIEGFVEVCA